MRQWEQKDAQRLVDLAQHNNFHFMFLYFLFAFSTLRYFIRSGYLLACLNTLLLGSHVSFRLFQLTQVKLRTERGLAALEPYKWQLMTKMSHQPLFTPEDSSTASIEWVVSSWYDGKARQ